MEMLVRRGLHRAGFRYRLHDRSLPGTPDLIFPKFKAVLFVHGCFWHQHGCARSKLPQERRSFWSEKLAANKRRDTSAKEQLLKAGWRVGTVWECAVRGPHRLAQNRVTEAIATWLHSEDPTLELAGIVLKE